MSEQSVENPLVSGVVPVELSRRARQLFASAPLIARTLQTYRPYICPFEVLLEWVRPGQTVLDVGCGCGLWLGLLADLGRLTKKGSVGFDSAASAIAAGQAMRQSGGWGETDGGFELVRLDVRAEWPTAGEGFDIVSMIDVMHHVPIEARKGVLKLCAERARVGGMVIYKDMTHRSWRAWMNRLHDLLLARQWVRYTPAAEVEAWARELGLKLVHASHHRRWWYGHDLRVFVKDGCA